MPEEKIEVCDKCKECKTKDFNPPDAPIHCIGCKDFSRWANGREMLKGTLDWFIEVIDKCVSIPLEGKSLINKQELKDQVTKLANESGIGEGRDKDIVACSNCQKTFYQSKSKVKGICPECVNSEM